LRKPKECEDEEYEQISALAAKGAELVDEKHLQSKYRRVCNIKEYRGEHEEQMREEVHRVSSVHIVAVRLE
jgi:hypothetical protein